MEFFLSIDRTLFLFVNHLPHTPVSDCIGLILSGVGVFGIFWFLIGIWFFIREERKDHLFWILFFLTNFFAWVLSEIIAKNIFVRGRPSEDIGALIVETSARGFSFPSSHTTVAFATAYLLSYKEPRWRWVFFIGALFVGVSRIYLGKHYPTDVMAGAFFGIVIGWIASTLYNRIYGTIKRTRTSYDTRRSRGSQKY